MRRCVGQVTATASAEFQSQVGSRLTCDAYAGDLYAVSIPGGKPPHVRRASMCNRAMTFQSQVGSRLTCDHASDAVARCASDGFNPRWEAASRATSHTRACRQACHAEFQSQVGSRLTCDHAECSRCRCRMTVSIPGGKPPHVRRARSLAASAGALSVSIPGGKPPHVRRHDMSVYELGRLRFQSQVGSRLTCDRQKLRHRCHDLQVSIPGGKPPHVRPSMAADLRC